MRDVKRKDLAGKAGLIFLAMNLVGIAVALFLENGLGSDSIGLLCDGISCSSGMRYGNASLAYNLVVIALAVFFARRGLGAGTVVYALCSGYFIDFYRWILEPLRMAENPLWQRFAGFAAGQVCLSLALAVLIEMKLGMNALDALLCKAESVSRISYAALRTGSDLVYVIAGAALGGTFGVGTILSVLLTGTMVSKFGAGIRWAWALRRGKKDGFAWTVEAVQGRDSI